MKDLTIAVCIIVSFFIGALGVNYYNTNHLTCAQAVLHNNVAKCAVFIDKDVMR